MIVEQATEGAGRKASTGGKKALMTPLVARSVAVMVRCLLPLTPKMTPDTRAVVEEDVVDFVVAQLGSMPAHVRMPYLAVLVGFELLAIFRFGRPFSVLSIGRRTRYLSLWTGSDIPLVRDIMKPVRSCALLQYFDHPYVLTELEAETPVVAEQRQ